MPLDISINLADVIEATELKTLKQEFARIHDTLKLNGIDFSLIGVLALGVYTTPRITQDVDILLLQDSYEKTKDAMEDAGFDTITDHEDYQFHIKSAQKVKWET